ncbi:MAG: extracellular solute-binding protein [Pseudomonadota bacterium]
MPKPRARVVAKTRTGQTFWWAMGTMVMIVVLAAGLVRAEDHEEMIVSHGYSFFGDLTYPADFKHFDYVNPDAPKGGEISIPFVGTLDSMNPYSGKGRAHLFSIFGYESLLGEAASQVGLPADVYGELYGLLAERLEYPKSKPWVIFYMRPEARFSDGTPVTAHDVAFSHNLFLDQGLKSYADAVRKRIPSVEVIDDYTIKFNFAPDISRRSLIDQVGTVPVFSRKWFEETGNRLDENWIETPPGSGPYVIESVDLTRRIVLKRNEAYWGKDLPINVGRNNFDRIRLEIFGDDTASFEGFKAGEYTYRSEGDSKKWATGYEFPKIQRGQVVKKELRDGSPPTPTGIVFNLGREVMQDKRVREAISLAYNFEWTNSSLQYGLFKQRASFTQDTPLMAKGVPQGDELELLKSLGDLVPADLLTEEVRVPHTSDEARLFDRRNARQAMRLLDEAGYAVGLNGFRQDGDGNPLKINFLLSAASSATGKAVIENFVSNVKDLGIDITLETVDTAQYTSRERERDYDLVFDSYAAFLSAGTGLRQRFGSEAAEFSLFNPAGLASPLVDKIIDVALTAETREEEVAALMALDRVLRYELFMIPLWYKPDYWVSYYDQYEHPDVIPPFGLGHLDFWWFNEEKAAALKEAGALR